LLQRQALNKHFGTTYNLRITAIKIFWCNTPQKHDLYF